jgi:hypothetical protein
LAAAAQPPHSNNALSDSAKRTDASRERSPPPDFPAGAEDGTRFDYNDFDEVADFDPASDFDSVPTDSDAASSSATTEDRESPPKQVHGGVPTPPSRGQASPGYATGAPPAGRGTASPPYPVSPAWQHIPLASGGGSGGGGSVPDLQDSDAGHGGPDRQAEALLGQYALYHELSTWVNDADDGYTFTQAISECSVLDSMDRFARAGPQPRGAGEGSAAGPLAPAPAPMEAAESTSSRVASLAGYAASFRDHRAKFANAGGGGAVTDLEYESAHTAVGGGLPGRSSGSGDDAGSTAEDDAEAAGTGGGAAHAGGRELMESLMRFLTGRSRRYTSFGETGRREDQVRAGIALCELTCRSLGNRDAAAAAGAAEALSGLLATAEGPLAARLREVAAAGLSNLAAGRTGKRRVAESDALPRLQAVVQAAAAAAQAGEWDDSGGTGGAAAAAAAAAAAGALWSLCVGSDENRQRVGCPETVKALVQLLGSVEPMGGSAAAAQLQAAAAGCLSECCIRSSAIKSRIAAAGGVAALIRVCTGTDIAAQRCVPAPLASAIGLRICRIGSSLTRLGCAAAD